MNVSLLNAPRELSVALRMIRKVGELREVEAVKLLGRAAMDRETYLMVHARHKALHDTELELQAAYDRASAG